MDTDGKFSMAAGMSNRVIEQMLTAYNFNSYYDKKNAIKEIMQEIVLCGLSRSVFFKSAAFYGGTILRMFYGLNRFSEDLDFSLMKKEKMFDLLCGARSSFSK